MLVCLNYDTAGKLQMSACPCQGIFLHGKESCDYEGRHFDTEPYLCPSFPEILKRRGFSDDEEVQIHQENLGGIPLPVVCEKMGCTPVVVLQAYARLKDAKELKKMRSVI